MDRDGLNITLSVVVSENNVNHMIDIEMDAILHSEEGRNRIIWRSRDGKYHLSIWKWGHEEDINPENVIKDESIVSSKVEIAGQVNRLKLEEI
jgi:hypothetical protein